MPSGEVPTISVTRYVRSLICPPRWCRRPSPTIGVVNPEISLLEQQAREKLPAASYDYYAGGAGRERTLRANERAWRRTWLAPRVLRDVSSVDTTTQLLGTPFSTPIGVAPTAFHSLAHPGGEVATAVGAARAGALFVLSFRSSRLIEDVAAAVSAEGGTWWFQVYMMHDRARTEAMVRRAAAAGARALVLTGDTPVVGRKRRDSDDLVIPDEDALVNLGPVHDDLDISQSAAVTTADIGWLADISGGLPVVVKGVLRADDATACAAAGAAAVLVSNHGGRQLDGAIPAAWALPDVVAALASGPARAATTLLQTPPPPWPAGPPHPVPPGSPAGESRPSSMAASAAARTRWPRSPWARGPCSSAGRCCGR